MGKYVEKTSFFMFNEQGDLSPFDIDSMNLKSKLSTFQIGESDEY